MGDITKLPKWAQDELANRDRKIRDLNAHIENLKADHHGSNVAVRDYLHGYTYLPENSPIVFYMEPDPGDIKRERANIEVNHQHDAYGDELILRSSSMGERLSVMPSASNSVRVRIGR